MAKRKLNRDVLESLTLREIERFHRLIRRGGDDECWKWTGHLQRNGYGIFFIARPSNRRFGVRAHRVALTIKLGHAPYRLACHRCHNRICMNPRHLYDGSDRDNINDMVRAKRSLLGERNHCAKLTRRDVRRIRRIYARGGVSQQTIANEYGVTQVLVSKITLRRCWRHI